MCEKSKTSKIHFNSQKLWPNSIRNQTSHSQIFDNQCVVVKTSRNALEKLDKEKLDQMTICIITLNLDQKDLRIVH